MPTSASVPCALPAAHSAHGPSAADAVGDDASTAAVRGVSASTRRCNSSNAASSETSRVASRLGAPAAATANDVESGNAARRTGSTTERFGQNVTPNAMSASRSNANCASRPSHDP